MRSFYGDIAVHCFKAAVLTLIGFTILFLPVLMAAGLFKPANVWAHIVNYIMNIF